MSEYDNIKTARELVECVKLQGMFSTNQEDINHVQDIFGNASEQELAKIAEDKNLWHAFYSVLFNVWHWSDAARFYNEHNNPLYTEGRKAIEKLDEREKQLANCHTKMDELAEKVDRLTDKLRESQNFNAELEKSFVSQNNQVLRLKAKIYDMEHESEGSENDEF